MEQCNNVPAGIIKVKLTAAEKDGLEVLFDKLGYRCGDDGWIPTLRDVEDKLIGRYYEKVREKLEIASRATHDSKKKLNEIDAELKQMWIFMYWILDTCLDMDPVAYERLLTFVNSKYEIVG